MRLCRPEIQCETDSNPSVIVAMCAATRSCVFSGYLHVITLKTHCHPESSAHRVDENIKQHSLLAEGQRRNGDQFLSITGKRNESEIEDSDLASMFD